MGDIIEERTKKIAEKLNLKKNWYWFVFAIIAWVGYWIRTRNVSLLIDATTGKYIPSELDSFAFLRYAQYILENGSLYNIDYMRYYPWGYPHMVEFSFLSNVIVYLYKFLHFFNSSMTLEKADVLYPPIAFIMGLVFFFLLVKKLFDYRVALLSSLLLIITPPYLPRTTAGFGDKEALAMAFFFAAIYFFVMSWKSKSWKGVTISGILAGISTGLMGLVWGGSIFAFLIFGMFAMIYLFFIRFSKKKLLAYSLWLIVSFAMLMMFREYQLFGLIAGFSTGFATLVVFSGIIYLVSSKLKIENKIKNKIPLGVFSLACGALFSFALILILFDFSYIVSLLNDVFVNLTSPFGQGRWVLTVAEAHQPYFTDWIDHLSWKYMIASLIGSSLLFYDLTKKILNKKERIISVSLYTFMILGIVLNRYSASSVFNGESFISRLFYFGSMIVFISSFMLFYLWLFKNKERFQKIRKLKISYIFAIAWFIIMILSGRTAIRLLMILAPITIIIFSYFVFRLIDISIKKKEIYTKIGLWAVLFLVLINPISLSSTFAFGIFDRGVINNYYTISSTQARYTSPGYNIQWQKAGEWVRNNTPEPEIKEVNGKINYSGPVFAHWWDYGYWVQGGFRRATVTDGGNAKGSLNHMMGRHFLTGENETEALEFFKAHDVTHALIISDEIGKYPAFSSIGADENWDRYSWINVFSRDDSQLQEGRDGVVYAFVGGTPLDADFEYNGKLYPKGNSGIIGILLPMKKEGDTTSFGQPQAVLIYNGKQDVVPVEYLFVNGEEMKFPAKGLKGSFMIIPAIIGDKMDALGNGLYISEKVRNTLFYRMYLTSQEMEYFKLVYNDEAGMPLSVYNGRVIGPLKIWEVSYPDDLAVPEIYYEDRLPNPAVDSNKGRF